MIWTNALCLVMLLLSACSTVAQQERPEAAFDDLPTYSFEKVEHAEEEWQKQLSEDQYYVLRQKGTERAFTGDLLNNKKAGIYSCAACGLPLFHSSAKFRSGTGWPSFYIPMYSNTVAEERDESHGMVRTEVLCSRCDGHLGHVFNDGPAPTGLRYCLNSVSLAFDPEKED